MSFKTLISIDQLSENLTNGNWVVVDCRFRLDDPAAGRQMYEAGHIPGAVYADLDEDLSGPPLTDHGRHPLPAPKHLIRLFSSLGIDNSKQVVIYDDWNGGIAARLWWLLRYMGHDKAAVLSGGMKAWIKAGYPTTAGIEENRSITFTGEPRSEWLVFKEDVPKASLLIDARAPERFRGEFEPLDPVAGHIPGAVNHPIQKNLNENGQFLDEDDLKKQLESTLGSTNPSEAVFYCGSGVTACHNLLALAHAGLGEGRLYAGSWSDWIHDESSNQNRS